MKPNNAFKFSLLNTPLGAMVIVTNEEALYLLEFEEPLRVTQGIQKIEKRIHSKVIRGKNKPMEFIEWELTEYFKGRLKNFKTPIVSIGSLFQQSVWHALQHIPLGCTQSYADLARVIGKPSAYRAVAQANGANQIAIVVPCHRVINADGKLGGYGGGIARKQWLLDHERGQ